MKITADRVEIIRLMERDLAIRELMDLSRDIDIDRAKRKAARFLLVMQGKTGKQMEEFNRILAGRDPE